MRKSLQGVFFVLLALLIAAPVFAIDFGGQGIPQRPSPDRPPHHAGVSDGGDQQGDPPPVVGDDPDTPTDDPAGEEEDPARPGPCRIRAFKVVARALQLDEGQREQWRELLTERHDTVAPLREQLQQVQAEIKDLLASPDPDPARLGELMLEAKQLREEIARANQDYREGFESMLDGQQLRRLEGMRKANKVAPLLPAFRSTGLVAPHPRRLWQD